MNFFHENKNKTRMTKSVRSQAIKHKSTKNSQYGRKSEHIRQTGGHYNLKSRC